MADKEKGCEDDDALSISLVRRERTVRVEKPDAERTEVEYTLREMTAMERDQWLQRFQKRMKRGTTIIQDFVGIEADLVAACLYDERDVRVPLELIKEWPASQQRRLAIACRRLNLLDAEEDDAKN